MDKVAREAKVEIVAALKDRVRSLSLDRLGLQILPRLKIAQEQKKDVL